MYMYIYIYIYAKFAIPYWLFPCLLRITYCKVLGFSSDSAARDPTGVDIAQVEDKPVSMLDMATGQNPY